MNRTTLLPPRPHPTLRTPRWPVWARLALTPVALLAALFLAQFTLLPFASAVNASTDPVVIVGVSVVVHAFVLVASLGLLWLMTRWLQRCRLRDIGVLWSRASIRMLGVGLGVSLAIGVPAGLVLESLGLLRPYPAGAGMPVWADTALAVSMAFLLQGIPEELFFRGWALRVLGSRPVRAVWISALVFGTLHLISSGGQENTLDRLLYVAMATGLGMLAGALAVTLRSVWAAAGVHAGLHLTNLVGSFLGVGYGPWLWATLAVLQIGVAVALLRSGRVPARVRLER